MFFSRPEGGERAILVSFTFHHHDIILDDTDKEEFELLCESAGFEILTHVTGQRSIPSTRFFIGSGKVDELKELIALHNAKVILFNHALSPSQERNLEKTLDCYVLDRTGIILDIFSQRAQTFEGRLQVELAKCQHMATRLVRGWTHLERQQGGAGTRGGPGETQLEIDRRLIRQRINQIEKRLEKVRASRNQSRRARKRAELPVISIVGYTNAGKSTLFNVMTDANVLVKDQLFATLDTTLRRLSLETLGEIIIADTVGFVKHLPHKLVNAFRATLEESIYVDILLHVVDAADPNRQEKIDAVNEVLQEIEADQITQLVIYNKIDQLDDEQPRIIYGEDGKPLSVWVSAAKQQGLTLIKQALVELLAEHNQLVTLIVPPKYGALRSLLYEKGGVQSEQISEQGSYVIDVIVEAKMLERLKKQYHEITIQQYENA